MATFHITQEIAVAFEKFGDSCYVLHMVQI